MLHPLFLAHFPLLFRGCLRRFGTFADIYARLLGVTSGPRLRRCSLLSLMPIQLPKKLPLKKRGKCTTGSACSSAATNAASCLPPIMAHLPSSAHALPAKWRLTAAKRARLPICPTTKLRALASEVENEPRRGSKWMKKHAGRDDRGRCRAGAWHGSDALLVLGP